MPGCQREIRHILILSLPATQGDVLFCALISLMTQPDGDRPAEYQLLRVSAGLYYDSNSCLLVVFVVHAQFHAKVDTKPLFVISIRQFEQFPITKSVSERDIFPSRQRRTYR